MNSDYLKTRLGGLILGLTLIPGIAMVSSISVQAQDRRDRETRRDSNRDRGGDRNQNRNQNNAERNRNRNDQYRGNNQSQTRDRDDRYRGRDRDDRRVYTYPRVYNNSRVYQNRGYGGYGYGNQNQIAESRGYQDGLNTGASDAQRGQSYNPQRSHYYRNAGGGYGYSQAYRNGFVRGYQQGYQSYGGYGRGRGFPW